MIGNLSFKKLNCVSVLMLPFLSLASVVNAATNLTTTNANPLLNQPAPVELADIEGPIALPVPFPYHYVVIAVLAVIALVAIGIFIKKKFMAKETITPSWDRALGKLEIITTDDMFVPQSSAILREYIEERFLIKFTRQTSEEFLSELRGKINNGELQEASLLNQSDWLEQFLNICDMAKFARKEPDNEDIAQLKMALENFIRESIPKEEK